MQIMGFVKSHLVASSSVGKNKHHKSLNILICFRLFLLVMKLLLLVIEIKEAVLLL